MNYISKAADALLANSICRSVVGPDLYTMIADWEKRGVPIEIVLESIDDVRRSPVRPGTDADTIRELRQIVREHFALWLKQN